MIDRDEIEIAIRRYRRSRRSPESIAREQEYRRAYFSRADIRERYREYQRIYRQRPEVRARIREWQREYNQRPEVRERRKLYQAEYRRRKAIERLEQEWTDEPGEDQWEPLVRCLCLRLVPESQRCTRRSECREFRDE